MNRTRQSAGTNVSGSPQIQKHMERIPKAQQRFVMQVTDTVLAQQDR